MSRYLRKIPFYKKPLFLSAVFLICCTAAAACFLLLHSKEADVMPAERISGPAEVRCGDLHFRIPDKIIYEIPTDRDAVPGMDALLYCDSAVIGGILIFPTGDLIPAGDLNWLHSLPLSEWKDTTLGYDAGSGENGSVILSFFSDVPPGTPRDTMRKHYIYPTENQIYDLWFDELTAGRNIPEEIAHTVSFQATTAETASASLP